MNIGGSMGRVLMQQTFHSPGTGGGGHIFFFLFFYCLLGVSILLIGMTLEQ